MRKPLLQWLPTLLALWITLSVILACGCNDEAREDVPKASASGEPSSATTPMADAAGGTPVEITPTATPGQLETGSSVTPDNGKPTPMPGYGPPTGSTATATPEPEPTRAATSTSTPTPQPTAAQPATAIPAPETSRMSVDEYLAEMCVQEETARSDQEMTDSGGTVTDEEMKQRSFELGTQIAALEAIDPPAEFGYFHEQLIVLLKSEKAVWDNPDEYKGETVVGFVGDEPVHAPAYIAALFDNLEVFTAAMKALDPGVRELLAAAGCNLEGLAGMDANETDIELEVGESVQAALDKPGEWDNYFLEADQGERYVIEVGSGTVPDMWVILPDGLQVDLESKPGEERKPIYWEAEIGGMHHIVVGGDGTGSYSISVSLDPRPEGPTNVRSVHEGSAMRVSWEPADGADYYNVYFHDNDYCASGVYARTLGGCEELATNVSKTTYLHASPSDGYNYYWVVACNKEGCSEIDSDNPATQSEAGSTGSIATPTPASTAPTPTPTSVPTAPTPTPTSKPVPTATATPEPEPTRPATPTSTPTPQPTAAQPATPTPTPIPTGISTCERRDRDALVAIYNALAGTNWRRDQNWLSEEPVGSWYGVTVGDDGCVTRLELRSNELSGEPPPALGNLSELKVLDLSNNNRMTGEIPAALGNLSLLEHLDLSDQTGQTDPSYALSGDIPPQLGNLTNLRVLRLSFHRLSGGAPPQLASLIHLETLDLGFNELSGSIPTELGSLPRLRVLILGRNQLSGSIPSELGSISTLEWLDLRQNNLSREIPPQLGGLSNLGRLDLMGNSLSGGIPSELGNLSSLTTLRLDNNSLEGGIPTELGALSNLNTLNLSANRLNGEIPRMFGFMRELVSLDVSDNNLVGTIPGDLGGLPKLESLDLRENSLSGGIPADLAQLPALTRLFVAGNEFTGCIPPELRALGRDRAWDPERRWLGLSIPRESTDLHELGLAYCSVPPNQRYAYEGSAVRVSWDPVDGADYYTVYHDDLFGFSCDLDSDGNASLCEELATNVVGTSYQHASPSDGENYYWVVACAGDECSEINSPNPAKQVGTDSPEPSDTDSDNSSGSSISAPSNVRYAHEGTAIRVSWELVAGADYYNVYHDDLHDSRCTLNRDGSPRLCDELAMNIVGTTYLHTSPGVRNNYYWVTACTGEVCSEIESANPATPIEAIPSGPGNVRYTREGAAIRVNWDPEVGADYYTVYYDDFHDSRCRLNRDGNPGFCEELATNVTQTTYVHTEPDKDKNYYWVVACNRGGCSEIDSDNPAVPSETSSTGQTGADSEPTGRREVRFTESGPTARSILENTPGGINVGDPVTADADGKLTYTMSGPDAGSFSIVSSTGQVRTRNGVTYDYETRNRYQVNVGASDGDGGSASIDVVINIENLVPACEPVRNLRTNHGDRHLVVNWTPASQRENSALVQGYQVQMLHGDNGARTGQYLVLGRSIGSAIFDGLQNLDKYWFQIRPIGAESDCGWSPPFLGIPATYLAPMYPGDRFRTDPVGGPDRNWRFLTDGRCRYTRDDVTADANCTYSNTGPDTSRIVLEFDDPSRGSCDIALAFSSLTAGSFVEDCFGAGVNTETPFDTSFRMPSLAPRAGDNVDPTPSEEVSQLAPRNQDEFDWLVFGRDDFIPGLCFGSCLRGKPPEKGVAKTFYIDADGGRHESYGEYEYERTGPNQGKLTLRMRGGGAWVFLLDFEPSGNVRATITDRDGNVTTWPGSLYADLTLGAQPILLPIPPSWWAAIAIEADYTPEELAIDGVREEFVRNALVGPLLARAVACPLTVSNCTGTNFSQDYLRLGRNRAILTVEFPARDPEVFDSLEEPLRTLRKTLNGSTYSFDITYTADGAAEYTLTITKEGHVPVVKRGFVDFKGDSIELDEFPEEIRLPVAPPQATGQDRSHVAVAAALSASRIRGNDLQTFLISDEGVLPASYQPGEWLEPKDGSNQRMMIVSAGPSTASSRNSTQGVQYAATNWFSPNSGGPALATHAVLRDLSAAPILHLASFASSRFYPFGNTWSPYKLAAPTITQLQVVCMQQDSGIPTRGDRYFSQPKSAEGVVQLCQRDCVLNETTNIQQCVWECEENARRN